jgi:hypothetical protein
MTQLKHQLSVSLRHFFATTLSKPSNARWVFALEAGQVPAAVNLLIEKQAGPPVLARDLPADIYGCYDRQEQHILIDSSLLRAAIKNGAATEWLYMVLLEELGHYYENVLVEAGFINAVSNIAEQGARFALLAGQCLPRPQNRPFIAVQVGRGWQHLQLPLKQVTQPGTLQLGRLYEAVGKSRFAFFKAGKLNPEEDKFGHFDIEEKGLEAVNLFTNELIIQTYYGNWLRDYSQLIVPSLLPLPLKQKPLTKDNADFKALEKKLFRRNRGKSTAEVRKDFAVLDHSIHKPHFNTFRLSRNYLTFMVEILSAMEFAGLHLGRTRVEGVPQPKELIKWRTLKNPAALKDSIREAATQLREKYFPATKRKPIPLKPFIPVFPLNDHDSIPPATPPPLGPVITPAAPVFQPLDEKNFMDVMFRAIEQMPAFKEVRLLFGKLTPQKLGVYRPEEHIDHPKGLEEATLFDPDLYHEPEEVHMTVDPEYGMLKFIRSSTKEKNLVTAADYIVKQLTAAMNEKKLLSASANTCYHHLGAALHTLEDYFAHSNFVEVYLNRKFYDSTTGKRKYFPWVENSVVEKTTIKERERVLFNSLPATHHAKGRLITKDITPNVIHTSEPKRTGPLPEHISYEMRKTPIVTGVFTGKDTLASIFSAVVTQLNKESAEELLDSDEGRLTMTLTDYFILSLLGAMHVQQHNAKKNAPATGQKKETDFINCMQLYCEFVYLRNCYAYLSEYLKNLIPNIIPPFIKNYIKKLVRDIAHKMIQAIKERIAVAVKAKEHAIKDFQNAANQYNANEKLGTSPTHTRIAKDDPDHPLHGFAAKLAIEAITHIGIEFDSYLTLLQTGAAPGKEAEFEKAVAEKKQFVADLASEYLSHPAHVNWPNEIFAQWLNAEYTTDKELLGQKLGYSHYPDYTSLTKAEYEAQQRAAEQELLSQSANKELVLDQYFEGMVNQLYGGLDTIAGYIDKYFFFAKLPNPKELETDLARIQQQIEEMAVGTFFAAPKPFPHPGDGEPTIAGAAVRVVKTKQTTT